MSELDLSNLFSPVVVLDTNVLRTVSSGSVPFQILRNLVAAKVVRVILPELILEERRTQWREQYTKRIDEAQKALTYISKAQDVASEISFDFDEVVEALSSADIDKISKRRYQKFISENGFEVRPMTLEESKRAWQSYFQGGSAFKDVKNRNDIPDGHIFEGVRAIALESPRAYFVCQDKGFAESAKKIDNLSVHSSLEELIELSDFSALIDELETQKKWQKLKTLVSDTAIKELVAKFVLDNAEELLEWGEIHDPEIPSDEGVGLIVSYSKPSAITVGQVEDWGAGYLRCQATFITEALFSFSVYKGDAFDVPSWVSVSIGDLEKDHYFDAEAERELEVSVPVSIAIDLEGLSSSSNDDLYELDFEEGDVEIRLAEGESDINPPEPASPPAP